MKEVNSTEKCSVCKWEEYFWKLERDSVTHELFCNGCWEKRNQEEKI